MSHVPELKLLPRPFQRRVLGMNIGGDRQSALYPLSLRCLLALPPTARNLTLPFDRGLSDCPQARQKLGNQPCSNRQLPIHPIFPRASQLAT